MISTKMNLLVVEDDAHLRTLFSAILARSGYTVRSAHDGFQVLVEIKRAIPDLILSDLYMEGMSGFELLSVVRRRFPTIRVLAMSSAYSGPGVPDGIVADAFYAKGGAPNALLRIIEDMNSCIPAQPSRENTGLVPIWLARDEADGFKERFVLLTCPECLRGFPKVAGDQPCIVHTATCFFCRASIQYAFV